ncbi:hypothetical protein K3556_11940 [Aliiroseovarius sp. M344]|uniref:hypothetical protein n=1 Tax=Aliiroseovarius sp. M344 TaxID=2867010 RepID=UPI0021AD91B6|nr:hypothetical protein [Aliiroseovarius sp. M344]UWQ13635.1 hypothetical protein K3556_11940 [Aliiroseovarius sp. M344]
MFYEMVATLVSAFAGAGIVLILNKISGGRLPKWAMPVGAALAMVSTTVANEYAWYDRTKNILPEGMTVVMEVENNSMYRPWTYAVPFVERFAALDEQSLRTHQAQPDLRMVELLFMGRWSAPEKMVVLGDCAAGKRAPLIDAVELDTSGEISGIDWVKVPADDPILSAICKLEVTS